MSIQHGSVITKRWRMMFIGALLLIPTTSALADDLPADCMQSFNVNPSKFVTHYGWLPGGQGVATPLTCTDAELLREKLYVPSGDDAIGDSDVQSAITNGNPLAAAKQSLQDLRSSVVQQASPSAVKVLLDTSFLKSRKRKPF